MNEPGSRREFGRLAEGVAVEAVTLRGGALAAEILNWGAVVRDLRHAERPFPLVLGFDEFAHYREHSRYFGATAGRCANRIAEGRFTLDGVAHQLDRNFLGRHHLHGGTASFGRRPWAIEAHDEHGLTLSLVSADGDGGYPGRLAVTCRFELAPPATLRITYEATTDRPTIVNLAHHSYFNLDGRGPVHDHWLQIDADSYLPVDETLIPTGEVKNVAGTPYDFRRLRRIGNGPGSHLPAYDVNFCLALLPRRVPVEVARATSADGSLAMTVWTTEPGVQFYDGATLDVPVPGLDGIRYGAFSGFCLEPQRWPDSPNRPEFTDATLRPGQAYRQVTEYRFEVLTGS